jgi:aquaporin NIP
VRNTLARRCAAEGAGAFILVLIGPGAAAVDHSYAHGALGPVGIALAFFFALLIGIAAFAPVSGAHFNPAVTLGFWSIGRFRRSDIAPYIVAQCSGATLAAFLLRGVLGESVRAAATVPAISIGRAFAIEFVFSAILISVILRVSSDGRVSASLAAISVAACVGGLALLGALTGSSMNPARSLGPALASGEWRSHWIYWAAPISGMVLIARLTTKLTRDGHASGVALESPLGVEGPIEAAIAE